MLYEDNARGLPGDDALSQWMTGRAASSDGTLGAALLLRLLDEIDYGLLLLDDAGEVRLANRQARLECDELRVLRRPEQLPVGAAEGERRDGEEEQLLAARVLRKQCHVISPTARGARGATASNPDGCSSS